MYIPKARRAKAATVHVKGKDKYPIDSEKTAKSAVKLINNAKPPLTSEQKAAVRRKAASFGVKSGADSTQKPEKKAK